LTDHILVCDPKKIKWCSMCKIHTTMSDCEMKKHKAKAHPCHLKYYDLFKASKKLPMHYEEGVQCLSIKWNNLDKDTLFSNPE